MAGMLSNLQWGATKIDSRGISQEANTGSS